MPFWQRAATFLAFIVVAGVIVFAGHHREAVSSTGGDKLVVVAK